MTAKFIRFPFAVSGDVATVPDTTQSDGTVSYQQGFGPDYALPIDTDPSALPIPRAKFNQLMNDISGAIQQYQMFSVPDFITSAMNGGVAFSYSQYVRVRYDAGSGPAVYESLINSNTDLPTVTTSWRQVITSSSPIIYGGVAGGTANALTFAPVVPLTAYNAGTILNGVIQSSNNSSPVTVAVSALSARTVKKSIGGALVDLAVGDLQGGTAATFFDNGTVYILMNPRTYSHAAPIATSATLNLDLATGDYVSLTGTVGVIGVTLQEGREVTCVAGGAFTITNSASLINRSNANIAVVAGDSWVWRGEAGGVVRMVNYSRADGTPLIAGTVAAPTEGSAADLKIVQASNTTAMVTYSEVIAKTALGGQAYLGTSGNFTLNCATTGANGLDTGTLGASLFYSIYAIFNPTSNTWATLAVLTSTSSTAIYAGTHMPAGYTASALIGWFLTDASSHIKPFYQLARQTWFPKVNALNITASVPTTFTAVSLAAIIPPMADSYSGVVGGPNASNTTFAVAADANGTGEIVFGYQPSTGLNNPVDSFVSAAPFSGMPNITNQFFYKSQSSTSPVRVDINGCTF